MIKEFLHYYDKAKLMQGHLYEGSTITKEELGDDLVWNVPIYDVVNRKYAAFSSLPEALWKGNKDPKNNGIYFQQNLSQYEFCFLCYLFRLCGSGINYKPKIDEPFGSHGFGNFWIVDMLSIKSKRHTMKEWIRSVPDKSFSDNKGYMLPMIPKGLKNFIKEDAFDLFESMYNFIIYSEFCEIKDVVDYGNELLLDKGFKRQNFVLTAFAMDMAEYIPEHVDPDSDVYVGSNAKKCLKMILPGVKTDDALRHLCDITGNYSKPYDMEDVACDFIRYKQNFQSAHHIENNNGKIFTNSL